MSDIDDVSNLVRVTSNNDGEGSDDGVLLVIVAVRRVGIFGVVGNVLVRRGVEDVCRSVNEVSGIDNHAETVTRVTWSFNDAIRRD